MGAGPAGLAMARALKRHGIPFDVFERHSDIGGIWDQSNPGSPIYDTAHFISSKPKSHFLDFEMPAHYPDYPSHGQILAYLRAFASAYRLRANIHLSKAVDRVEQHNGEWRVTLANGESKRYAWLIAASGANWHPRMPSFPGAFTGEVRHAVTFRSADEFRRKRVLIVGAGNSGCDIACDAARSADTAFISLRRGYHFLPKHIFGEPLDVFAEKGRRLPTWLSQLLLGQLLSLLNGDLTRFGLKAPDHRVLESHPIVNSQILHYLSHGDLIAKPNIHGLNGAEVIFDDGTRERIDLIIFATGYHWELPYLREGLMRWDVGRPDLYMSVFSREHPALFVLGLFEINVGAYQLFDQLADLIARAVLAQERGGNAARRFAHLVRTDCTDLGGGIRYVRSPRHAGYINSATFEQQISRVRRYMGWPRITAGYYSDALAAEAGLNEFPPRRPHVAAR